MNDEDDDRALPANRLADELGLAVRTVHRHLRELGISSQIMTFNGSDMPCYPVGTLTQLRNYKARLAYEQTLPKRMSAYEIAEALGRSEGWTRKALKRSGIEPVRYAVRRHKKTALYAQSVYRQLRDDLAKTPEAEHDYTLWQMVGLTGRSSGWIKARLKELGIMPTRKRSPLTGKDEWFYDEDTLRALKLAASLALCEKSKPHS